MNKNLNFRIAYLIGGGRIWMNETERIDKQISDELSQNKPHPRMILFAAASGDRSDYIDSVVKVYNRYNIDVAPVKLTNEKVNVRKLQEIFKNADAIYLGSGDPQIFINTLSELNMLEDFIQLLKQFEGVLIGLSSGAALLSERYIDPSDLGNGDFEGWGIVEGVSIIPHFNEKEGLKKYVYMGYIPIKDCECLKFTDGNLEYIE